MGKCIWSDGCKVSWLVTRTPRVIASERSASLEMLGALSLLLAKLTVEYGMQFTRGYM